MAAPFAFFSGPGPWLVLAALTVLFLWVDLHFFARGREPSFREGVWWSVGWLGVSLLGAVVVLGHRRHARAAGAGDPRRRRADRAVPLRDLRPRRAAAGARVPDPARRRGERRPGPEPDRPRRPPRVPGHELVPRAPLVPPGGQPPPGDAGLRLPGGDRRGRH